MRVNETDNDQVICANIQKRIKSRTWSAQLSQFFFFLTSMLEMQSLEPPLDLQKMAYLGHDIQRKEKVSIL